MRFFFYFLDVVERIFKTICVHCGLQWECSNGNITLKQSDNYD